jgi:hypothetical protein
MPGVYMYVCMRGKPLVLVSRCMHRVAEYVRIVHQLQLLSPSRARVTISGSTHVHGILISTRSPRNLTARRYIYVRCSYLHDPTLHPSLSLSTPVGIPLHGPTNPNMRHHSALSRPSPVTALSRLCFVSALSRLRDKPIA